MKLEQIIETYGKNDYYDMKTGRIYKLSEMHYNKIMRKTRVYVEKNGGCYRSGLFRRGLGKWKMKVW